MSKLNGIPKQAQLTTLVVKAIEHEQMGYLTRKFTKAKAAAEG